MVGYDVPEILIEIKLNDKIQRTVIESLLFVNWLNMEFLYLFFQH